MKRGLVLSVVLAGCAGSSEYTAGAITGQPRPEGIDNTATDPTAGEIKILAVGPAMQNILSPTAMAPMASQTDREAIRRIVREDLGAILECYQRALKHEPTLAGTVHLRWIIQANGRPQKVEASGMDLNVASCLAALVRSMQFEAPASVPLRIDFPFAFRPFVVAEAAPEQAPASSPEE
jgi:hypothetical protein